MLLPVALRPVLSMLQAAYPAGVPGRDYAALLVVLSASLSEENLAVVVAELIDGETVVVANDAAAALSHHRPPQVDVERVRRILESVGWSPDYDDDL